jgi:hypothetical protein
MPTTVIECAAAEDPRDCTRSGANTDRQICARLAVVERIRQELPRHRVDGCYADSEVARHAGNRQALRIHVLCLDRSVCSDRHPREHMVVRNRLAVLLHDEAAEGVVGGPIRQHHVVYR